jgi:hypothetical protein
MAILLLDDIKDLLKKRQPPCVSLYIPMLKGATEANQNSVRFKNLFRQAEDDLRARGMRKIQIDKFLEPARWLLQDSIYWHQPAESFAMFLSADLFKTFRFGRKIPQTLAVGERFYTKPLLPLFFENGRFYILAVSQKDVRFFQAARDGARQLEIPDLPQGIGEILRQYVGERHIEFHTQTAVKQGGFRQAYYHGQGDATLHTEDKIQQYLYQVDRCVHRHLQNEHAPLVFAGVDYLFPMYKLANTYRNLVDEAVIGNPDRLSTADLHQAAYKIVEPRLEARKQQMLDKYRQFAGTSHTTTDVKEVVFKATQGRVDTLLLAEGTQLWGKFNPHGQVVELHENKRADSDDLLDLAANETFLSSGVVYEFAPGLMPDKSPVAAILRY